MNVPTLLSIQVGMPTEHGADAISDQPWRSGIVKRPVDGPVWLGRLNLDGDGQADLKNHGGPYRVVLAYSAEHYDTWRAELPFPDMPYGAFGENLTIAGLDEETVCIGDIFTIGGARVQVAQPRQPYWKLARRWGSKELAAHVEVKMWGGWYHRVLQEGYIEAGQAVTLVERPYPQHTVMRAFALMNDQITDPQAVAELAELEPLSPEWRKAFAGRAAIS